MIRLTFSTLFLLALCVTTLRAQEAPEKSTSAKIDLESIKNPPKRQIQFEHKEQPFGPGQLEPVIAIVRLRRNSDESDAISSSELIGWNNTPLPEVEALRNKRLDAGIGQRAFLPGPRGTLFERQVGSNSFSVRRGRQSLSEYFPTVLKAIPSEVQPESSVRDFYASENVDKGFLKLAGDGETGEIQFEIMARDKASAESLAAGLLYILDWGVSRPIQLSLLEERDTWDRGIARLRAEQEIALKQVTETKTKLEQAKDFSSEGLTDMRTQQRLLQVDIAGAKARGEACDRLFKAGLSGERSTQVFNLKITAEIELAGLEAKKAVLDELVAATSNKKQLEATLTSVGQKSSSLEQQLRECIRARTHVENGIKKFGPRPLVDGKVTIITRT